MIAQCLYAILAIWDSNLEEVLNKKCSRRRSKDEPNSDAVVVVDDSEA